jgi:hypothetical protein
MIFGKIEICNTLLFTALLQSLLALDLHDRSHRLVVDNDNRVVFFETPASLFNVNV